MKRLNFDILDKNHDVTAYERHYTSSLLSTRQRRNSSPAISTSWPQPWSRDQASVRHPRMTGGTPPPNCVTSIHNRRVDAGMLERHLKHSPRRSGESDQPPARKRIIGPFWSQNLTVDLHRIYQFIWHPRIWQHDRNNYIVTTNAQKIIFCLNFARQLQTNHEQTCTQNLPKHPRVDTELAGETLGLRRRRSVLLNTFLTLRILFTIYPYAFSSAKITVVVF